MVLEALPDVGGHLSVSRLLCQLEDSLALAQQVSLRTRATFEVSSVADEDLHALQVTVLGCYHERGLQRVTVLDTLILILHDFNS